MKKSHSNVLLVEILIAVLFFMLSCTVLVRVFEASRNMTLKAGVQTEALTEAQNVAEAIYGAGDVEAELRKLGFASSHGSFSRDCGDFVLYVSGKAEEAGTGQIWKGEVKAFYKTKQQDRQKEEVALVSLPCVWYMEAAA